MAAKDNDIACHIWTDVYETLPTNRSKRGNPYLALEFFFDSLQWQGLSLPLLPLKLYCKGACMWCVCACVFSGAHALLCVCMCVLTCVFMGCV